MMSKEFLICIDSDGCVFDNMELKHKECFCPATVNVWNLQSVSRYAREAAEYVNLYSTTRGINRYPGIILTLQLLADRKEAKERGYKCPDLSSLDRWIHETNALSISALEKYIDQLDEKDEILETTLRWSKEVDANIAHIVRGAAHFPNVEDTLKILSGFADIVIVSATPREAILREWEEHDLLKYVTYVCGQEDGSKAECIRKAVSGIYRQQEEKTAYDKDRVVMIGDAMGDYQAASDNGVLFYPIIPNKENESWRELEEQVSEEIEQKTYKGKNMEKYLSEFDQALLKKPAWA